MIRHSIVAKFEQKAHILTDWKEIHERTFPGEEYKIPNAKDVSIKNYIMVELLLPILVILPGV